MNDFATPRIVVSKCLGFEACRYNGEVIPNRFLAKLAPHAELELVCPEVEIGLGTPRAPIRIVRGKGEEAVRLVQPSTGLDLTDRMEGFRDRFLDGVGDADGFVLKSRSPSCALTDTKIHADREGAPALGRGPGLFGAGVLERFGDLAVEDEGRLTNFRIREHFLTRIFATAAFRAVRKRPSMGRLVEYQARNKLLLMAVSQKEMRALGKIVANHERRPVAELVADYEVRLRAAFAKMPRYTSHVNVLMHALGYFRRELGAREKAHFLDALEGFRAGRLPLSAPVAVVRSWTERFEQDYLAGQTYFRPFPEELVETSDYVREKGWRKRGLDRR